MGFEDLLKRYQKKIGTYDKQQWEKTIEQRILDGIPNIQLKSAKPKNDLIDLDLIRGSSFSKAKPKHGFMTVTKKATLRFLFLPFYARWWIKETSKLFFFILLGFYFSLVLNIVIYWINTCDLPADSTENVPCTEIIIPTVMMWILSLIHSQIVATNAGPEILQPSILKRRSYRRKRQGKRVTIDKSSLDSIAELKRNDSSPSTSAKQSKRIYWKSNLETKVVISDTEKADSEAVAGSSREPDDADENRPNEMLRGNPKQPMDDDGFESLNGYSFSTSDSGEDERVTKKSSLKKSTLSKPPSPNNTPSHDSEAKDSDSDVPEKQKRNVLVRNKEVLDSRCDAWVKSLRGKRQNVIYRRQSEPNLRMSSDSDSDTKTNKKTEPLISRRNSQIPFISLKHLVHRDSSSDSYYEEGEFVSSPETGGSGPLLTDNTTSATEWLGVTTNSEDCSYSSEYDDESDSQNKTNLEYVNYDFDLVPSSILSPSCALSDRVNCAIWDRREIKTAELSVFDISSAIIAKVESMPESVDYFYFGLIMSTVLALLPVMWRVFSNFEGTFVFRLPPLDPSAYSVEKFTKLIVTIVEAGFGKTLWERTVMVTACIQRWVFSVLFFFLLAVAERTFKQRFLYAKLFTHLTSSRRARKSELPHFRLNKVRNIKTWLSVRSYLKKRGPQRSVDVIVSAAFIITFFLLFFLSIELLKETVALHSQYNIEAMIWIVGLGILLLRFMTLGTKINKKYRNLSVLITEQINLYLKIEQKPHKKEELTLANNVLKLAADLLKELESPFKISGLSANPYLYTITKVFLLSALSSALSEMLGFKLKLHKINVK